MAIPFLNNINLDDNQLLNAKLHVTSSAPTAAQGQIYFDSTTTPNAINTAKYYDGSAWISLIQHTYNNGTFINLTEGGTDATRTLTAELSATGTPDATVYLRGDNTWSPISAIPGTYTFDVTADSGTNQTVNSGDVLDIAGGTYVSTVVGATDTVTINHDDTSRTDTTSTDAPGYGGTFEAVTSVTTNATGHVTAIDVSTVTIPASENDNDFLTGLSFNTGDGILTATVQNQSDVTVDLDGRYLTGNETITLTGEVTGSGTNSISTTVADGVLDVANFNANAIVVESEGIENNDNDTTLPTSAAVKAYVDATTVGGLIYQGGFDGSTGYVAGTTDYLDSRGTQIAVNKGWTYTVTVAGTFYGENVEVGDVLIAEDDLASGTGTLADWTTVQNNIDLASLTQVGIGNVAAGTGISVAYSSGTATVTNTDTNSSNTFADTITDTDTVEHGLGTKDVIVQLYDVTTGETVYADVERTGANDVDITFATTPTNSIRVLVQKIG